MDEYISREETIKKIEEEFKANDLMSLAESVWVDNCRKTALSAIMAVETANVPLVKRGRWKLTTNPIFRKCSECGAWWDKEFTTNNYVNYCPRCGADMREPNE